MEPYPLLRRAVGAVALVLLMRISSLHISGLDSRFSTFDPVTVSCYIEHDNQHVEGGYLKSSMLSGLASTAQYQIINMLDGA